MSDKPKSSREGGYLGLKLPSPEIFIWLTESNKDAYNQILMHFVAPPPRNVSNS